MSQILDKQYQPWPANGTVFSSIKESVTFPVSSLVSPCLIFALAFYLNALVTLSPRAAYAQEVVPGQFLIKFSDALSKDEIEQNSNQAQLTVLGSSRLSGTKLVTSPASNTDIEAKLKNLLMQGVLQFVEPNYIYRHFEVPQDTYWSSQWGLSNTGQNGLTEGMDIAMLEAWAVETGSPDVVVAVLDSGIDITHPDLRENIWSNPYETADNGIDDDLNGVTDDEYGFNAINNNGDISDGHGHGTHVAGIIGALANDKGIRGVTQRSKLMPLKFLTPSGGGTLQDAVSAIEYAIALKRRGINIQVINCSWGGEGYSEALFQAIELAGTEGILFIAAAGNSSTDNDLAPIYPASYALDNIISVGAIDGNGNLAEFSNFGLNSVHIAAPGVDILSLAPGGGYVSYSGTSMAAPFVSGTAALLFSQNLELTPKTARETIMQGARQLTTLTGAVRTNGLLNADNALKHQSGATNMPPAPFSYEYDVTIEQPPTTPETMIFNSDDGYITVDLDFDFVYYRQKYRRLAISANGRVIPLLQSQTAPSMTDYANSLSLGINPYHDDIDLSADCGDIICGVWFSSDTYSADIRWVGIPYSHKASAAPLSLVSYQLTIDRRGKIDFWYLDTESGDENLDNGASASVGLVAPIGSGGTNLSISHNEAHPELFANSSHIALRPKTLPTLADFDGDGISDITVWRPQNGTWYILTSSSNFEFAQHLSYQHGLFEDIPILADVDGDQISDLTVWRPSDGTWYMSPSSSSYTEVSTLQWGLPGDTPLSGDFDGDNIQDFAVFRPSNLTIYFLQSQSEGSIMGKTPVRSILNYSPLYVSEVLLSGSPQVQALTGDFDGDHRTEIGLVDSLTMRWMTYQSSQASKQLIPWGEVGDLALTCDWDHDDQTDQVITRSDEQGYLVWYALSQTGNAYITSFGLAGDIPSCAHDYDGDGKHDIAVYRPTTSTWYLMLSKGGFRELQFGLPGDLPL